MQKEENMAMEWLKITTSTELVRLRTDEIVYVSADGNYSDIYLCSGKTRKLTFKLHFFEECFDRLKDNFFVRLGRSLIINRSYVQVINLTEHQITLAGGKLKDEVRINRVPKDALKELKESMECEQVAEPWVSEKGGCDE